MPAASICRPFPLVTALLLAFLALPIHPAHAEDDPAATLATLAEGIPNALAASQPVLLGKRSNRNQSAVQTIAKRGMVTKINHGTTNDCIIQMTDANGGIGLRFTHLALGRKAGSPKAEFNWQQTTFRPWLEEQKKENAAPLAQTQAMEDAAATLLPLVLAWDAVPDDLAVPAAPGGDAWPAHCLAQLLAALQAKDIDAAKRWSLELRGATFALADLHRWTDLLVGNLLRALEFQAHAKECFDEVDPMYGGKYNSMIHVGRLPAGEITLYGGYNYLEVERQAERLFWVSKAWKEVDGTPILTHHAAAFLPPTERGLFLKVAAALSGKTHALWNEAAATPFERSFLANMLWRAESAEFGDAMTQVVLAYEQHHGRRPDLAGLLDVLPYRAGAFFAGLEWGDRYDPEILKASSAVTRPGEQGMKQAHAEASKAYSDYTGLVLTIRQARETKKADCIRITDVMAALYRNAGQPGFRSVRMSRGGGLGRISGMGHTIAGTSNGSLTGRDPVVTLDGLIGDGGRRVYPTGYLDDQTFTTEVYGRGIDSYVWMAGVVGKGSNKGRYMTAAVPYLPDAQEESDTTLRGASGGRRGR